MKMPIYIEKSDRVTLAESVMLSLRFWLGERNKSCREYARREVRAAIRLMRAIRRAGR